MYSSVRGLDPYRVLVVGGMLIRVIHVQSLIRDILHVESVYMSESQGEEERNVCGCMKQ